jgi:putative membrane protein insertion efficiency factor
MSPLRQRLRKPRTWVFLVLILLVVAAGADSFRPPDRQITAKIYIGAVHGYQRWGRPISNKFIRCRYHPTCSVYSIEAVEKYGIRKGLVLTTKRLISCRGSVPLGTFDPVP